MQGPVGRFISNKVTDRQTETQVGGGLEGTHLHISMTTIINLSHFSKISQFLECFLLDLSLASLLMKRNR